MDDVKMVGRWDRGVIERTGASDVIVVGGGTAIFARACSSGSQYVLANSSSSSRSRSVRCRPNTLRAVAFDLKAFFAVVAKDPIGGSYARPLVATMICPVSQRTWRLASGGIA